VFEFTGMIWAPLWGYLFFAEIPRWTTLAGMLLIVAAGLESVFGLCLGCKAFALLMRFGVIPAEVCERCNNIAIKASGAF